jgi:hypothetical protein
MNAIGGYFELELPDGNEFYPDAIKFQSARAAFLALLQTGKPRRVWVPRYICNSMLAPLQMARIEYVFYGIDNNLEISDHVELRDNDWLLYVNYFGICSQQVDRVLSKFNPKQIIIDHSQAFFSPPRDCLATIYSPRKFFGVPDGGLLFSQMQISQSEQEDAGSFFRMVHLLKRLTETPESGYVDFQRAEASLQEIDMCRMSPLTQRILKGIDYPHAASRRNNNFNVLHELLGSSNNLPIEFTYINGPFCYPFLTERQHARELLIADRIFIPTYWPEVRYRDTCSDDERRLVQNLLPLPCDQRYSDHDMEIISNKILAWRENSD